MKTVINGKKYDTETAKKVTWWTNNYPINDFKWQAERLYLKTTGEYFLKCEGGPLSEYCHSIGHGYTGGEEIQPLSLAEAKAWVEKRCPEDYEDIFGPVPE